MPRLYGTLRLRPIRIGFLVRPSQESVSTIRKVMRLCCCLWGGEFNPLIPVSRTLPSAWKKAPHDRLTGTDLTEGYLRFFEPDVFVEAEKGLAEQAGIKDDHRSLESGRVISLDEFVQLDEVQGPDFAYGLNIFDLYRHLYERELQFVPRYDRLFGVFDHALGQDAFAEAVFGVFPKTHALGYIQQAYLDAFNPRRFSATPSDWLECVQNRYASPFWITRSYIECEPTGHSDPVIFVFDPTQTTDLMDFWNLRQFKQNVLPMHVDWITELASYLRATIEHNYRPLPRNPHGVMIHTTIEFARSIPRDIAERFARDHLVGLPNHSWVLKHWYDPLWRVNYHWRHGGIQPRRATLAAETADIDVSISDPDNTAEFRTLSPAFAEEYGHISCHARWVNVLQLKDYGHQTPLATTYLPNTKNPGFPQLGLGLSTVIAREGIVLPQRWARHREFVRPLPQQEAIIGWLKSQGVEAKPSGAGRNTAQVLRAIGGVGKSTLLADEPTVRLLDKMAKSVRQTPDGTLEEYPDRTASVQEWKQVMHRRGPWWSLAGPPMERFTQSNILKIGLTASCPHCAKENWYSLTTLDYTVICERCLREFAFPQAGLRYGENDWRYRVIGPFSVPDYADGAYSTILTLRVFSNNLRVNATALTFSTGLDIEYHGARFEVDFVAWYQEGQKFWLDPAPMLMFGETKSFGTEVFHQKDMDRLKTLAALFPGAFFVLSAMKREFGEIEKARMRAFAAWGRTPHKHGQPRAPVIVLTGTELFSVQDVKQAWEKVGGRHAELTQPPAVHLDDLWTLADVTQQLYLDMPSHWEWLSQRSKRRRTRRHARDQEGRP